MFFVSGFQWILILNLHVVLWDLQLRMSTDINPLSLVFMELIKHYLRNPWNNTAVSGGVQIKVISVVVAKTWVLESGMSVSADSSGCTENRKQKCLGSLYMNSNMLIYYLLFVGGSFFIIICLCLLYIWYMISEVIQLYYYFSWITCLDENIVAKFLVWSVYKSIKRDVGETLWVENSGCWGPIWHCFWRAKKYFLEGQKRAFGWFWGVLEFWLL